MDTTLPKIPESTLEGITAYIEERRPPGGFLRAVLENNLSESFGRADENNQAALLAIVQYIYWKIPGPCWGSPDKVNAWLRGDSNAN